MEQTASKLGVEISTIAPVHTDARGSIFDIVEEMVGHVGMVTFTPGAVRGNHYHFKSVQYNYVLSGTVTLTVEDQARHVKEEYVLSEGSFARIPAGVIHTYSAQDDAVMLDMNSLSRGADGYEADTKRI